MTGFSGQVLTSSTGAKSIVNPSAASSVPTAWAMRSAKTTSPQDATVRIGGTESSGAFNRATRPPS
jgi:hypothetical protein